MSERMAFFHHTSGSQQNSNTVVDVYRYVKNNSTTISKNEPEPLEQIWQSDICMKICEYVRERKLKF